MSNHSNSPVAFLNSSLHLTQHGVSKTGRRREYSVHVCSKSRPPDHLDKPKSPCKRPYGYWRNPKNIHAELLQFLQEHEQFDGAVMPTQSELIKAGRKDLAGAIRRHGSWKKVADEVGLVLSSIAKPRSLNLVFCTNLKLRSGGMRPYMYWRDFNNLRAELVHVIQTLCQDKVLDACEDVLPSASQLEKVGRSDIARAIRMHGGWNEVAGRLDLSLASHPRDHWCEFANVEKEIRRIIEETMSNSDRNVMPALSTLYEHGSPGLYNAVVRRFGGSARVAKRMGLATAKKPRGYWSFANLKREVESSLVDICNLNSMRDPSMMPTRLELRSVGRSDVYSAIERMGGMHKVAPRLGLRCEKASPTRERSDA